MISFIVSVIALIVGYVVYGKISERIFVIKPEAQTPAFRMADGVDYVPMSSWSATLIQLLNIAGTGPIFGAIAGAMFGPAAFAWIVLGCIFAGAVHDYMVGMLSVRNDGTNISEIVGKYLGKGPLYVMRVFSVVLLIFVGVVFVTTPAQVLKTLFVEGGYVSAGNMYFEYVVIVAIIAYYVLATLLPIDKVIGKLYPIFGACLFIMAIGITFQMFMTGEISNIPEFSFTNMRPDRDTNIMGRLFPFLFITIACGAISGFHATQSPMMARCIKSEKDGRLVFYGAMILEGVIALIWAAVTMAHFDYVGKDVAVAAPAVVTKASIDYMGGIGSILAVFGVVACPITSGDTAFRSARLSIADAMKFDQKPLRNRFMISIPLFVVGIALVVFSLSNKNNFNIIWRYFSWSNQTLATIGLWAVSAYLAKTAKNYWFTLLPASFMTVVVTSYFMTARECVGPLVTKLAGGDGTAYAIGIAAGLALSAVLTALFVSEIGIKQKGVIKE
jgi:carbon starvation protein CstA